MKKKHLLWGGLGLFLLFPQVLCATETNTMPTTSYHLEEKQQQRMEHYQGTLRFDNKGCREPLPLIRLAAYNQSGKQIPTKGLLLLPKGNGYTYSFWAPKGQYRIEAIFSTQAQYERTAPKDNEIIYTLKTTRLEGNIIFQDDTTKFRPPLEQILISVKAPGQILSSDLITVQANAQNQWAYVSKNLPAVNSKGEKIPYYIQFPRLPMYAGPKVEGNKAIYTLKYAQVPIETVDKNNPQHHLAVNTQIYDETTKQTVLPIQGYLPIGHVYQVKAERVPFGYQAAPAVRFRLTTTGHLEVWQGGNWLPAQKVSLAFEPKKMPSIELPDFSFGHFGQGNLALGNLPKADPLKPLFTRGQSKEPTPIQLPSLDLPSLPKLGPLPDLNSLENDTTPNAAKESSITKETQPFVDKEANGGLGGFNFSSKAAAQPTEDLPQTKTKKERILTVIGAAIIATIAVIAYYNIVVKKRQHKK